MMHLSLEAVGLQEILNALKDLPDCGHWRGVELVGQLRKEEDLRVKGITNESILEWLWLDERRFSLMNAANMEDISKSFIKEMAEQTQRALDRAKRAVAKSARKEIQRYGVRGKALTAMVKAAKDSVINFDKSEKWARQAAGRSLHAAMRRYMGITSKNIMDQTSPMKIRPLSARYLKWKLKEYGFGTIGKLTGQLLENLDETLSASAVRLTTK